MLTLAFFLLVQVVILAQLSAQTATPTCSSTSKPILLPWTNVTLEDGIAINRGIAIELGNQRVALRGTTLFSNTRLRNSRDCAFGNASIVSGCYGASGSSFDIQKSSTWEDAPVGKWNVTVPEPVRNSETLIEGYDSAQFQGLPDTIPKFPFAVWSDLSSTDKSGLALGPDSSFISSLLSRSLIPSGTFGLFFGSRSQTRGVDGELVLGGVDRARHNGSWTNFTVNARLSNASCPLQVLVKDVRLNNERGSFSLFADTGAYVVACIDPLQNQFTLTQSMYNVFASLTNHPTDPTIEGGSNFTEQTYPLSAAPLLGDLTIELNNGYTTHIPSYEFVSQERGPDVQGKYAVVNASRLMVAAGTSGTTSLLTGTPILVLGGVYLSQNYLMVDYDSGVFRMAPAVIGPIQAHDIVPICGGQEVEHQSSSAKTTTTRLGGGKIAGIVVGVVAIVAILMTVLFYYRKRNRMRQEEPVATHKSEPTGIQTTGTASADADRLSENAQNAPERYRNGNAQLDPIPPRPRQSVPELP